MDRQAASGRSEKPAYSIVILNYNYGRFLHSCIRSVLSQTTLRQVEIIVVDDGSTDDSVAIMNEYAGRIIAAKKDNGGQASAINLGFSLSSGSRVLFLDADDELSPGCLQAVDDNWRPGLAAFSFNLDLINEAGSRTGRAYRRGHRASHGGWATAGGVDSMPMSGNVFSREFLLHTLPMPEREWRRSADVYLCNIAALTGETGSIDTCLGSYRVHGENGSKLVRDSRVNRTRLTFLINRDLRIEALHENILHDKALEKIDNQRLTACLAHQQLRFIHDLAIHDADAGNRNWRAPTFESLSRLIRQSDLRLYKKAIIWLWSAMLVSAPRLMKETLMVFGLRAGFVLSASKALERGG